MKRDEFLSRVAAASMAAVLPSPPRVQETLPSHPAQDLVSQFRDNARVVNAVVHGPVGRHAVPRTVSGIASGHGASNFMAWDELPASGVTSVLVSDGLTRLDHETPSGHRHHHNETYTGLEVGVTGADAGLAVSGSVVLSHGPGRPRMASLAPEIHVVLLETGLISTGIAHWAHRHPQAAAETANLVFVTGPSRTGDIEQNLNLGVHGPRHLHIVLIK